MASMNKSNVSEEQIDEIAIQQSEDDSAWEAPVTVRRKTPSVVSLSPEIAARAAFLAELHRMPGLEAWIERIIEENAFADLKQTLASK